MKCKNCGHNLNKGIRRDKTIFWNHHGTGFLGKIHHTKSCKKNCGCTNPEPTPNTLLRHNSGSEDLRESQTAPNVSDSSAKSLPRYHDDHINQERWCFDNPVSVAPPQEIPFSLESPLFSKGDFDIKIMNPDADEDR